MTSILEILRTEYKSEYNLKKYKTPKVYHGGKSFDLTKRWYVYYSFIDPSTGKFKSQPPIYDNMNRMFDNKKERLSHAKMVRDELEKLLQKGWSPYENVKTKEKYSAKQSLLYALEIKKSIIKTTSYKDYNNRVNSFIDYLSKKGKDGYDIKDIDKSDVVDYLNSILKKSTARNHNNTKTVLSSIFSTLEDNELIDRNFIKNIKSLKTSSVRNKTYSESQVKELHKYMEVNDKTLLLFIKFVSYNFLRPIEIVRLKVSDINLKEKLLVANAKNKLGKTKIIPDILIQEFEKMDLVNPDHYLFTPNGVGEWETKEINKRNYFTKRYKKVKNELNLSSDYTIYSFRHTFITKLHRELRKTNSVSDTHDKLMLITGHSTLKALTMYLRDLDAELPEDYSDMLTN